MIVVAAPAKRGEGLPRLCDSTPTGCRTTYGDKRYALSSTLWNIIFYNSGAHKNGESPSKEKGIATLDLQEETKTNQVGEYLHQDLTKVELQSTDLAPLCMNC